MQAVRHLVAMAFEEDAELTAATFYGCIISAFRYADNRFHLFLVGSFRDVVYQLLDNLQALQNFIHTDKVACP